MVCEIDLAHLRESYTKQSVYFPNQKMCTIRAALAPFQLKNYLIY